MGGGRKYKPNTLGGVNISRCVRVREADRGFVWHSERLCGRLGCTVKPATVEQSQKTLQIQIVVLSRLEYILEIDI